MLRRPASINNPYQLMVGYQPHNPKTTNLINGFGISIMAINYWLYDHQLPIEPHQYNQTHYQNFDQQNYVAINDAIQKLQLTVPIYYHADTVLQRQLFIYDNPMPQEHPIKMPSFEEMIKNFAHLIIKFWQIPTSYHDSLTNYLYGYCNLITLCDFHI